MSATSDEGADREHGARETPAAGRLSVIALDGIPEIQAGDDLSGTLIRALRATPDLLPLREDDVLVVTQKIVSKAEGAIVDLTTVRPRP